MLKKFMTCALMFTLGWPAYATTQHFFVASGSADSIEHSGGCRKDSPAGMCCHAGSKPYHCH